MTNYNKLFKFSNKSVERSDMGNEVTDAVSAEVAAEVKQGFMKPKGMVYRTDVDDVINRGSTFEEWEFNLGEIARAIDTDSYIGQSMRKRKVAALKNGWFFDGKNPKSVQYIRDRLDEMSQSTNTPFNQIVENCIQDIVYYNNTFIEIKRDEDFSSGNNVRRHGKNLTPMAGLFNADATSMRIRRKRNGIVQKYRQEIYDEGKHQSWNPEDMLHIFRDRKHGMAFGSPEVIPVLDDVRALRRLEQAAEMQAHRHTFPLYHHIVGTENNPCKELTGTGENEIDRSVRAMEDLPTEGFIVTSERHTISAIESNHVLEMKPYLEYYEKRVLSGLDISDVDLGRGGTANRGCYTADTEVLTDRGWILHSEYKNGDRVAIYDKDTGIMRMSSDVTIGSWEVDEEIVRFQNARQDIAVTPEHTMLYATGDNDFMVKEAQEIEGYKSIRFRSAPEDYESHSEVIIDNDMLKFFGIAISEGGLNSVDFDKKGYCHMTLAQSYIVNSHKCEEIRRVLNSIGAKFGEYDDKSDGCTRWNVYGDVVRPLFDMIGRYSYMKKIPREFLGLPKEKLKHLFDGLMLGDGTVDKRDGRDSGSYYTASPQLADDFQELAFRLGKTTKKYVHREAYDNKRTMYRITLSGRNTQPVSDISREHYVGNVYCFNTPTGFYVTRRNGLVAIQGNTATTISKNIVNSAKDIQAAFEESFTFYIIDALLREGNIEINEENKVFFRFHEVDPEAKQDKENHALALYQGNIITSKEARSMMGKEEFSSEEESDLFLQNITIAGMKAQAQFAPTTTAPSGSSNSKTKASVNKTANKNRPTNQAGKKRSALSSTKNDKEMAEILKKFTNSYIEKPDYLGTRIARLRSNLKKGAKNVALDNWYEGAEESSEILSLNFKKEDLEDKVDMDFSNILKRIDRICDDLKVSLTGQRDEKRIRSLTESIGITLDSKVISVKQEAMLKGYYAVAKAVDAKVVYTSNSVIDKETFDKEGLEVKGIGEILDLHSRFAADIVVNEEA